LDIILSNLANLENEATATATINANNDIIELAFQKVLSTVGPNTLTSNIDANGNRILNLLAATAPSEPVRKAEFDAVILQASAGALLDGSVSTSKIADGAVSTTKIPDNAITLAKMADASVGTAELVDASVTTAKIVDASVTDAKLPTMVNQTLKGNFSGGTAAPSSVTLATLMAALTAAGFGASPTPVGAIFTFGMVTPPTGYLECNGTAISRTTYATLFTAIGVVHGTGDGTTTFNLPDLRGQFIRGFDNGRGVDTGRSFGSTQTDDLKSHTHPISVMTGSVQYSNGGTAFPALNGSSTTGSTGGTETRPRNTALIFCIKT
jgi:microcystin-dependent protein